MSVSIRIISWILKADITCVTISVQETATSADKMVAKENRVTL